MSTSLERRSRDAARLQQSRRRLLVLHEHIHRQRSALQPTTQMSRTDLAQRFNSTSPDRSCHVPQSSCTHREGGEPDLGHQRWHDQSPGASDWKPGQTGASPFRQGSTGIRGGEHIEDTWAANPHAKYLHCATCNLRLRYVPRHGSHGRTRLC